MAAEERTEAACSRVIPTIASEASGNLSTTNGLALEGSRSTTRTGLSFRWGCRFISAFALRWVTSTQATLIERRLLGIRARMIQNATSVC